MPKSFQASTDQYGIQKTVIMPDMHSFIYLYLLSNKVPSVTVFANCVIQRSGRVQFNIPSYSFQK